MNIVQSQKKPKDTANIEDEPFVERYSKQAEGCLLSDFSCLELSVSLDSIAIALSMAEIYRGVVFE